MRRGTFLFSAATAALLLASAPAWAQTQGNNTAANDIETVVVTGTRIPRPVTDMASPIMTIGSEEIQHSGTTNLTDYLKRLPALAGSMGDYSTNGYATPASADGSSLGGLNLLDLRNLGYVRTLVLVDGHRTVSEATGSTAVDTESIPLTLIDRVEVVTGGASAVYGADGVSGVVNFVMKHNLEGVHARAQYGVSQDGGGAKSLAAVSVGHNFDDDKGNITLTVEGGHQEALYFTRRDFTKVGGYSAFVPNPNDPNDDPKIPDNILTRNAQFVFSAPTGAIDTDLDGLPDRLGNGSPFNLGTDIGGGSAIGSSGMPYAEDLQGDFQPLETRAVGQASGHYDFAPWFKLSGEFKFSHVETKSRSTAPFDDDIVINADNAFLPANVASLIAGNGLGQAILSEDYLALRNAERVKRNTYHGVIDVAGDIPADGFLSNMKYDVSYVYGQSNINDTNLDNRNIDRFAASLDSVIDPATGNPTCRSNLNPAAAPPDLSLFFGIPAFSDTSQDFNSANFGSTFTPGANSGCVPFNPFDPNFNNKAAIAFMSQNTSTRGFITEQVFNGYVSADLPQFKDWGLDKAWGIVVGGEWRKELSKSSVDPITQTPGLFWFGGTNPVAGSFTVGEEFAEVSAPIFADRPFVKELTFDGAVRHSDYSTAGQSTSWKIDGIYSPFSGLKLRGTNALAVRAPNIGELFAPKQTLASFVNDPCDVNFIHNGTQFREANCQTLEDALLGPGKYVAGVSSVQTDQTTPTIVEGNELLKPETARTVTLGGVIQPDFLPDFVATIDWYKVKIRDAIQAPAAQDVANECVDLSTLANPFCASVVRTATGTFPGSVSQVTTQQINVADFATSGIDVSIDYHADTQDWFGENWGSLDFHLVGNHLNYIKTTPLPGEAAIVSTNEAGGGVDGGATPYWQANLDVVWSFNQWTVDYNYDWYNGVLNTTRQTLADQPDILPKKYIHAAPRSVHSIQVGYDIRDGWNVYAGIDNMFYQKPSGGNDAFPVDPLGRFFYAGVKVDLDPGF